MSLAQRSFMQKAAMAVAPVVLAFATNAQALEMAQGQCMAPTQLMPLLKAEGQGTEVVGNRVWGKEVDQKGGRLMNVFTINNKGEAYRFEGDAKLGDPNTQFCLVSSLTGASKHPSGVFTLPAAIPENGVFANALRAEKDNYGNVPVLSGQYNGAIYVVVANPSVKDAVNGRVYVGNADPNRKPTILSSLANVSVTQVVAQSSTGTRLLAQNGPAAPAR